MQSGNLPNTPRIWLRLGNSHSLSYTSKTVTISLCVNYFSTIALWTIQIQFSIAQHNSYNSY